VRLKYGLLLAAIPLFALSLWLQLSYFLGLKADVITSCCGSMFSEQAETLASEVTALEARPAMIVFYGTLATTMALSAWHWLGRGHISGYLTGIAALAGFAASIAGILAFVSLYIYEHPHHHCPFCILKPEYDYQGYALYVPLFVGAAAGMSAGVLRLFSRRPSLAPIIDSTSRPLAGVATVGFGLFLAITTFMIWRSNLILPG